MAEVLLREALEDGASPPVNVTSAGVGALADRPVDPRVHEVMGSRAAGLEAHRSVQVTGDMLRWADLILVMEMEQRDQVRRIAPGVAGKVYRLGHWIDAEIRDPYLDGIEAFHETFMLVERAVASWAVRL